MDNLGYQAGRIVGQLGVFSILVLPVIWGGFTLRRSRANKQCVLSFMLITGMLPAVLALSWLPAGARLNPLFNVAVGLMVLVVWLASIVLATLGLAEFRQRDSQFGRKRAIVALVLCAVCAIAGICLGSRNISRRGMVGGNGFHEAAPPFTSESLNVVFTRPWPWAEFDVKRFNPNAIVGAIRANPPVYFMLLGEKPGIESSLTTENASELAKAHMKSASRNLKIVQEKPLRLHGIDGIRVDVDAELDVGAVSYVQWVTVYHGYAYQLLAWSPSSHREELGAEAVDLFQHFDTLHRDMVAHSHGAIRKKDYHSLTGGFTAKLAGTSWSQPIQKLFELYPSADFGAASGVNDAFVVIPLPLAKDNDPDIDILTQAFLGRFGVEFPGEHVIDCKKVTHGPLAGYALVFDRPTTPDLRYRAEVVKGNGFAYLLMAFYRKAIADDEKLKDVLSRIEFEEKPAIPKLTEFTSREKESRAIYFNGIGLAYYKKENFPLAKRYFRIAQELVPENPVFALNVADALVGNGNNREARDFLENVHGHARTAKVVGKLALLQQQTGDVQAAVQNYASAFSDNLYDDNAFDNYIGLLCQQGKYDDALAEIEKYTREHDSITTRQTQAAVYVLKKQFDAALKILHELGEKYPENGQVTVALAKTLVSAGRFGEAADLCDKMIGDGNGSSVVYFTKGRGELGRKRYREAKISFEAALKEDPSNANTKSLLTWVSGMLGQGDNTALKTPIEPVEIPAGLLVPPTIDGSCSYLAGCSAYYTNFAKAIVFKKNSEFRVTEDVSVKVLNDSGVNDFSSFDIPFDPVSEGIYVNDLTVRDSDGTTVSNGKVDDYYLMDDRSSGVASQNKLLHIPVSGLRPGCEVSLKLTRRDFETPVEFRYSQHLFSRTVPILRSSLYVAADPEAYKCVSTDVPAAHAVKGKTNMACWSVDQPPVLRYEPLQPTADLFLPGISLGGPNASWKAIAQDYLKSISDRLELDEATRQLAKEKTGSLANSEEKIAALIECVQKDFTYTAIEFGHRARIPNKAESTVGNRYGDCKDHSLLLRQLLAASGIHANLVLVNSRGEIHKEIPSLDQFNHMIVYIPTFRGGAYIDCTDKDSDLTIGIPNGLAKKEVLILDAENPRLASIPDYPPDSSVVDATRQVEIVNRSDISVTEDVVMRGAPAALFRNFYRRCKTSDRKIALQQQLAAGAPTLQIHDLSAEHLDDHRTPLALHVTYLAKGKFHTTGSQLVGQLPAVWERFLLASQPVDKRQSPFQLSYPITFKSKTTIEFPSGYAGEPVKTAEIGGKYIEFKLGGITRKDALQIDCSLRQVSGRFAPVEYAGYCEAMNNVFEALERNVFVMKVKSSHEP